MTPRRRVISATTRVVILLVVTAFVSAGVGLAAAWFVRSPAQVAADAAPPERTTLTAEVSEGAIEDREVFSGVVGLGNVMEFTPPAPGDVAAVITAQPVTPGATVTAGQVLIEVSDRPLIYLSSPVGLLRDLRIGDKGADVSRLQAALAPWGSPEPDGVFGQGTARALRAMYQAAGYAPPADAVALRSELAFGPSSETRLVALGGPVGATVSSPLVRVATSTPVVTAQVSESIAQGLAVGRDVTVTGVSLGGSRAGKVASIGGMTKSEDGGFRVPVEIAVSEEIPTQAVDSAVEITVTPEGETVSGLLVPLSAVYADATGGTFVQLVLGESVARVTVTVAATGDGQARVETISGELDVGDKVIVGSQ